MVSKEIHAKQALLSGIKKKKQVKKAENLQRHSVSKNLKKIDKICKSTARNKLDLHVSTKEF